MIDFKQIRNASSRDLKWFAGLQLIFFLIVAGLLAKREVPAPILAVLVILSLLISVVGVSRPASVRPIYLVWMTMVFPLGWIVSHTVMALAYFLVVTPIGFVRRRRSGDPMQRKFDPDLETYWETRDGQKRPETYFRQF